MGMKIGASAPAMGTSYAPAASAPAPAPAISSTAAWQLSKLATTLPKPPVATESSGNSVNIYA